MVWNDEDELVRKEIKQRSAKYSAGAKTDRQNFINEKNRFYWTIFSFWTNGRKINEKRLTGRD